MTQRDFLSPLPLSSRLVSFRPIVKSFQNDSMPDDVSIADCTWEPEISGTSGSIILSHMSAISLSKIFAQIERNAVTQINDDYAAVHFFDLKWHELNIENALLEHFCRWLRTSRRTWGRALWRVSPRRQTRLRAGPAGQSCCPRGSQQPSPRRDHATASTCLHNSFGSIGLR